MKGRERSPLFHGRHPLIRFSGIGPMVVFDKDSWRNFKDSAAFGHIRRTRSKQWENDLKTSRAQFSYILTHWWPFLYQQGDALGLKDGYKDELHKTQKAVLNAFKDRRPIELPAESALFKIIDYTLRQQGQDPLPTPFFIESWDHYEKIEAALVKPPVRP